ncbi:MAG: murein transglycosylase [Rhodospirillaceae bacterium]|nr:murein transglycosylase [Rhodospirillaceae bacterium]
MPRSPEIRFRRRVLAVGAIATALSACAPKQPAPPDEKPVFRNARFADLPGWRADAHAAALGAMIRSCPPLEKRGVPGFGSATDWHAICTEARNIPAGNNNAARRFFERNFEPRAVRGPNGLTGLITGYYEPELRGARKRTKRFNVPLYLRPGDLVSVNLGRFDKDLKGKRIAGQVVKGSLVPYHDRGRIERGALRGKKLELVWVDSATDAFFLHIQGSGRIRLRDGSIMRVGYADTNGHPYTAIGRELIRRGEVPRKKMSMQAIRTWLAAHPAKGSALMRTNKSFVFFRLLTGPGPLGAQGVALTPERSLAVDRSLLPLGLPVWLETNRPDGAPFRRLMVAQDTGGAIRGAVRADVFWGPGAGAADIAGRMKSDGRYWFLVPRPRKPLGYSHPGLRRSADTTRADAPGAGRALTGARIRSNPVR